MSIGPDGFRSSSIISGDPKHLIEILPGQEKEDYCKTFVIHDADHTLGNALKHVIIQNPCVSFCGYNVPHPMERKIHLRLQTQDQTALGALKQGLTDLKELNEAILVKVQEEVKRWENKET